MTGPSVNAPPERAADQVVPPGVTVGVQEGRRPRPNPARLPADHRAQHGAGRHAPLGRDGSWSATRRRPSTAATRSWMRPCSGRAPSASPARVGQSGGGPVPVLLGPRPHVVLQGPPRSGVQVPILGGHVRWSCPGFVEGDGPRFAGRRAGRPGWSGSAARRCGPCRPSAASCGAGTCCFLICPTPDDEVKELGRHFMHSSPLCRGSHKELRDRQATGFSPMKPQLRKLG